MMGRMKRTIALITLAALAVSALFVWLGPKPSSGDSNAPWQVRTFDDGGSEVFGLRLGAHASTLGDARARLSGARDDLQVAVIAGVGETGALEAYQDNASAGGITGKVIVSVALEPGQRPSSIVVSRVGQIEVRLVIRIDMR